MSSTLIKRYEKFVCEYCSTTVTPLANGSRDHCPKCLYSRHVDIKPGDRKNNCGGLLEPIGYENRNGKESILYKCKICGYQTRNKIAPDDNFNNIISISAVN